MPVIVPSDKCETWLDPDVTDFEAIRDILRLDLFCHAIQRAIKLRDD